MIMTLTRYDVTVELGGGRTIDFAVYGTALSGALQTLCGMDFGPTQVGVRVRAAAEPEPFLTTTTSYPPQNS